jgi:hypothetical protein
MPSQHRQHALIRCGLMPFSNNLIDTIRYHMSPNVPAVTRLSTGNPAVHLQICRGVSHLVRLRGRHSSVPGQHPSGRSSFRSCNLADKPLQGQTALYRWRAVSRSEERAQGLARDVREPAALVVARTRRSQEPFPIRRGDHVLPDASRPVRSPLARGQQASHLGEGNAGLRRS